jgi:hypothetical protein
MLGILAYKFERQATELSNNLRVNKLASNQTNEMSLDKWSQLKWKKKH